MGMPTNPNVAGAQTGPTGLNWGAFLIPFIWGPANNVWIGLVGLVGFFAGGGTGLGLLCGAISLGISIYLLIKGNDLAWRSGKVWQSGAQFQAVQKQWVIWGLVAVAVEFVVGLLLGMMALQRAQYVPQYPPQYPSGQ
jgi:hypothetical protein